MFRSERALRIICFEPFFLAFNPGGLSAKPYRTRVFAVSKTAATDPEMIGEVPLIGHLSATKPRSAGLSGVLKPQSKVHLGGRFRGLW